jgi:hypothetical protein
MKVQLLSKVEKYTHMLPSTADLNLEEVIKSVGKTLYTTGSQTCTSSCNEKKLSQLLKNYSYIS